jgi:flagellar motility protein MotE (MotC chaperone)
MHPNIPISVGELLDKISILNIKTQYSNSSYIKKELDDLILIAKKYNQSYLTELHQVNQKLWEIEDRLREKEKLQEFDAEFIELARSVYMTNDLRARIKKKINEETQSTYQEIKCYA